MAVLTPYKTQFAFSEEATFGTAIADDQAFTTFIEGEPAQVDPGLVEDKDIKYRNYYYSDTNDSFTSQAGGTRVITMPEHVVRRLDLSPLIYSISQTVAEAATTPYQKDFQIGQSFACPDFSSNAGYFITIGIDDQIANTNKKYTSCVLRTLTLTADLTGDGRLRASGEFISGFTQSTTANFSGTWAPTAQNYYNFAAPTTKTIAGSNVLLSSFSLTINNNLGRVGNDSSGDAENYIIPMFEVTGSLTVLYDTVTDGALADWIAGTARAIVLDVGTEDQAGYFKITIPNAEYTGNTPDYANNAGQMVTLPFKAMGNTTSNDLIDFEVTDANDFAW